MMEDRRQSDRSGWVVSKSLSLSHVFVTVSMALGGVTYVSGIDTKAQLLETRLDGLERAVEKGELRQATAFNELKNMIESRLQRLEGKIDKLSERRN